MRSINRRGKQVSDRLGFVVEWVPNPSETEMFMWMDEGQEIKAELAAAMHGEIDPATLDEPRIREWQATGRYLETEIKRRIAALGKQVRRSGMSADEAAQEMARGEFNPPD
jgi:hypothetical protein